jgi:hypothetical protein
MAQINQAIAIIVGCFVMLWTVSMLLHYREEILEERSRQRFMKALGLGKKFSVHDLRLAAGVT